MLKLAD